MFHSLCGERIQLLNENRTALRDTNEFNHGLVFGNEPLKSNYLFEVKIEQKVLQSIAYELQHVCFSTEYFLPLSRFLHGAVDWK